MLYLGRVLPRKTVFFSNEKCRLSLMIWRKIFFLSQKSFRFLLISATRFCSASYWTLNYIHDFKSVFIKTHQTTTWTQADSKEQWSDDSGPVKEAAHRWEETAISLRLQVKAPLVSRRPHIHLIVSFPTGTSGWYLFF